MKKVALISCLDTKEEEILYAQQVLREKQFDSYIIDMSTRVFDNRIADVTSGEILKYNNLSDADLQGKTKAECIQQMEASLPVCVLRKYMENEFQGILCIGGGQAAHMAACAMKVLPLGVPKFIVSPLLSGMRTMEQFVGAKDIILMHSVVDFSGLNHISKMMIRRAVSAVCGMLTDLYMEEKDSEVYVMSVLGITNGFAEGIKEKINGELICFHANGTGGRCLEELIHQEKLTAVIDANLHEITCELLGGYCTGADNRLMAAVETKTPLLVVPGGIDILDYYVDESSALLKEKLCSRRKVFHNSNVCHVKVNSEEMHRITDELVQRLNQAKGPVTVVLPLLGLGEETRKDAELWDPEIDQILWDGLHGYLKPEIKVVDVSAGINDAVFVEACIAELEQLTGIENDSGRNERK